MSANCKRGSLRISNFDRCAGWLIACLVMVEYAKNFSSGKPARRVGTRDEEAKQGRTYFTHQPGSEAQRYDRELLAWAGVDAKGRLVLHYHPEAVIQQMLRLQHRYRGLEQGEIFKTVFGIRRNRSGYELYVKKQIRR